MITACFNNIAIANIAIAATSERDAGVGRLTAVTSLRRQAGDVGILYAAPDRVVLTLGSRPAPRHYPPRSMP